MDQIQYTLSDLVNFSSQQKPLEFGRAFNALLSPRIQGAIEQKKQEISQSLFNNDKRYQEPNQGDLDAQAT